MDTTPQYDIWLDSEWWEIYDVLDSITNESIKKKLKKIILEIITFNSVFVTLVCIIFKKNKFDNIFFEDIYNIYYSHKVFVTRSEIPAMITQFYFFKILLLSK
jgi:hypothetical protein